MKQARHEKATVVRHAESLIKQNVFKFLHRKN